MVVVAAGQSRARPGVTRRRSALAERIGAAGLDALLVTDLVNVRYLTGFTGSSAALLVPAGGPAVLATDARYTGQAAAEVPDLEQVITRHGGPALLATTGDGTRVGFDSAQVTVDAHDELVAATAGTLVRAPGLVEALRAVKDDAEIDALRLAAAAGDAAFAEVLAAGVLAPGRTEREVARALEDGMRDHGATAPAFETIVAAGAHGAVPHHRPLDTPLAAGELVTMDFGALVEGYHSDMTRTVLLGPGADWQREVHDLVGAAAAAGRAALRAGVPAWDVDAAAREVIVDAGYGEAFVHGLGHGVGLVIHEAPAVSSAATATLEAGMTVTVEPGVYLAGRGGVRIEDTLVVREDGVAEPLTTSPRELLVLDP